MEGEFQCPFRCYIRLFRFPPAGDSTIYNMPNKVAPGYDNPPLPMPRSNLPPPLPAVYGDHSGMEEGVYNSSPHSFKSPPVPGQNGSGHRTDMFDMGKIPSLEWIL